MLNERTSERDPRAGKAATRAETVIKQNPATPAVTLAVTLI